MTFDLGPSARECVVPGHIWRAACWQLTHGSQSCYHKNGVQTGFSPSLITTPISPLPPTSLFCCCCFDLWAHTIQVLCSSGQGDSNFLHCPVPSYWLIGPPYCLILILGYPVVLPLPFAFVHVSTPHSVSSLISRTPHSCLSTCINVHFSLLVYLIPVCPFTSMFTLHFRYNSFLFVYFHQCPLFTSSTPHSCLSTYISVHSSLDSWIFFSNHPLKKKVGGGESTVQYSYFLLRLHPTKPMASDDFDIILYPYLEPSYKPKLREYNQLLAPYDICGLQGLWMLPIQGKCLAW